MKNRLIANTLLFLCVLGLGFAQPQQAQAASPPLDGGCYYRVAAGDFEPTTCPNSSFTGAVSSRGACFLTRVQSGTVFFEVRCSNFAINPNAATNTQRAQRVCGEIVGESYWNTSNNTCYYGDDCRLDPGPGGTIRTWDCSSANVQTVFERYVRGEFRLPGVTPTSTGSSSSGGSSGGSGGSTASTPGGSTGGGIPSGTGASTADDPNHTPEAPILESGGASCRAGGGTWEPTDPAEAGNPNAINGRCVIDDDCSPEGSESLNSGNCGIIRYIVLFTNVLSALAGIVIIASIIMGGIQYSSAGSDPQKVSAAKGRIRNAIIALLFFIFGYGMISFLVPGGLL